MESAAFNCSALANVERVKRQLSEHGLIPEDYSGYTITVALSAATGAGIERLLEMILLQADIMELTADPERVAREFVAAKVRNQGTLLRRNHVEPPVIALAQLKRYAEVTELTMSLLGLAASVFSYQEVAFVEAATKRCLELMEKEPRCRAPFR